MNKLDKIERDAKNAREKIAAMQALLKQIEGQRTEQENLQIVQQIRALKLSRDELYVFLNNGKLPTGSAGAIGDDAAPEPETIYSRQNRAQRYEEDTVPDDGDSKTTTSESEGIDNE